MIVAQLVRAGNFETPLSPVSPFVFAACVGLRKLKSEWGTSCDDIFDATITYNVKQVTRDYLTKYLATETLQDCIDQEGSYYFDKQNQTITVHIEHDYNPILSPVDYGYAFGVTSKTSDVIYVDDNEYLPIAIEMPGIEIEDETVGQSQPTGIDGDIQLDNQAILDYSVGRPVGILDQFLTESVYGNDVFMYDYTDGILTPVCVFYVESIEMSLTHCTIALQSRRYN